MVAASFTADFVAGWVAGAAGLLVGHPLDTVKVRLQALKDYKGALECVRQTLRQEAIGGFYKGMLFPFMSTGLLHSVYFGGYGVTLKLLKKQTAEDDGDFISPVGHQLTGSIIGAMFQWAPACPIENVKTKLQVQKQKTPHAFLRWSDSVSGEISKFHPAFGRRTVRPPSKANVDSRLIFTSPWDCLRKTIRHEGIGGLYRGGFIMLIRDVLGFSGYLPVYEVIKLYLTTPRMSKRDAKSGSPSPSGKNGADPEQERSIGDVTISHKRRLAASLVAGGLAGIASWFPILPFDMIKSRLQADDVVQPKYKGAWHCARESFRSEGLSVFFRGWQLVVIRAFPVNAILFLCYDETIRFIDHRMKW